MRYLLLYFWGRVCLAQIAKQAGKPEDEGLLRESHYTVASGCSGARCKDSTEERTLKHSFWGIAVLEGHLV